MKTLQQALAQDHSKKTKAELVNMLTSLSELITIEEYRKVSGIEPQELARLPKNDVLKIVESFNSQYNPAWEQNTTTAAKEIIQTIFGMMEADEQRFESLNVANGNFAAELNSIDFEKLIGGPLNAAVTAQTNASIATVNFIQGVAYEKESQDPDAKNKIRMVDFSYEESDGDGGTNTNKISVPFISLLNIPSFRIQEVDIDFNVKLNSVFSKNISNSFGLDANVNGGFGPVKFKVSASYKRSSNTGIKIEKQYNMGVKVKATNDEMPQGLESVLELLSAVSTNSSEDDSSSGNS